jgi:ADP-ribose pyrophosphatase YjhB (NUDIX family)
VTERKGRLASPRVLAVADWARRLVWRAFGPRTVGVRGLVVDGENRVLLVRHTYGPAQWHLPGGGVKRRESIVDALTRELREEVGVVVDEPITLHGVYSNMSEGKSDHISVFVVRTWRREDSESAEIDNHGFFFVDGLPDQVSRGTRHRIDEWVGTREISFDW